MQFQFFLIPAPLSRVAITFFIASLGLALGAVHAALDMHVSMLTNVFRWKMGRFDTTPLGRILNRFSKDVDVVDSILPQVLRSWIMMFFGVISLSIPVLPT